MSLVVCHPVSSNSPLLRDTIFTTSRKTPAETFDDFCKQGPVLSKVCPGVFFWGLGKAQELKAGARELKAGTRTRTHRNCGMSRPLLFQTMSARLRKYGSSASEPCTGAPPDLGKALFPRPAISQTTAIRTADGYKSSSNKLPYHSLPTS